ncbi:type II secretion system minor pseudopilin GspI [Haliea sp. E17]|uniref:type II secretion system minor pseudopilin GspI n=1 Tax=Haliea sp. E17 TaxID=3401576 RepID=UPI003AACAEBD
MIRSRSRAAGFTLVEVMVALAVVALALPALLFALSQQADATGYLRDKSIAYAVGANRLSEIRLLARAQGDLIKGEDRGVSRMAGRDWYWWVTSTVTDVAQFYRVEISVADSETTRDTPLYTLTAYLSADFRQDTIPGEGSGE